MTWKRWTKSRNGSTTRMAAFPLCCSVSLNRLLSKSNGRMQTPPFPTQTTAIKIPRPSQAGGRKRFREPPCFQQARNMPYRTALDENLLLCNHNKASPDQHEDEP